jgi:hypothetical protein
MDDVIYYLYHNGIYILAVLAVIKIIVILLYKGFDLGYVIENFLLIYTDPGINPTTERMRFRMVHNIVTIVFYVVLVAWFAIIAVVKLVR